MVSSLGFCISIIHAHSSGTFILDFASIHLKCLLREPPCPVIDKGVISVKAALYGRADRTTCSEGRPASQVFNTACSQTGTLDIVRTRCVHPQDKNAVIDPTGIVNYV